MGATLLRTDRRSDDSHFHYARASSSSLLFCRAGSEADPVEARGEAGIYGFGCTARDARNHRRTCVIL